MPTRDAARLLPPAVAERGRRRGPGEAARQPRARRWRRGPRRPGAAATSPAPGSARLGVVDGDTLDASNLHRQPLYALADVGRPKTELARDALAALNPEVTCRDVPGAPERRQRAEPRAAASTSSSNAATISAPSSWSMMRRCSRTSPPCSRASTSTRASCRCTARTAAMPACAACGRRRRRMASSATAPKPACSARCRASSAACRRWSR